MSRDTCGACRFWHESVAFRDEQDSAWGFGECRRSAPRVSDAIVGKLMPPLMYGESVRLDLDTIDVTHASLWPATAKNDWCGDFADTDGERSPC